MKKFLAILLSVLMVLGMCSVAFADNGTTGDETEVVTGSITMDASADGTVAATGKTFKAYKVLDVTYSGENYSYTVPAEPAALLTKLAEKYNLTKGADESDIAFNQRVVAAIATAAGADVEQTAKDLLQIAKAAGVTAEDITGSTTKSGLDLGYYVIEDTTTDAQYKPVSAVALTTTNPDVTIKVKASKPTLDKKIDEGETTGQIDASDVVYDNHRIGDTVPYVLETTVPEMTGYIKYFFVINDTLSKGLTFDNNVVIKRIKAAVEDDEATTDVDESADEVTTTLASGTDYTVTSTAVDDGTAIKIVFNDFLTKEKDHAGEKLVITYSATINADAVVGVAGNPNTAKLVYSNNPNTQPSSTTDEPGPEDDSIVSETPEHKTYTYVTGLKIKKVDESGEPLKDATFELSGNLNKVEVYKAEKYVEDENGTYFELTDGSFTTTNPTTLNKEADNYAELIAQYVDATGATKYSKATVEEKTAAGTPKVVSETTDEAGVIIFDGMGDGTFTLTETEAPEGYNKLTDPINFTVTWTAPSGTSTNCTWTVGEVTPTSYQISFNNDEGEFEITIENKTGVELPSTGGIGTTIFYVLGSMLALAAVVLLIAKRRVNVTTK